MSLPLFTITEYSRSVHWVACAYEGKGLLEVPLLVLYVQLHSADRQGHSADAIRQEASS